MLHFSQNPLATFSGHVCKHVCKLPSPTKLVPTGSNMLSWWLERLAHLHGQEGVQRRDGEFNASITTITHGVRVYDEASH